MNPSPPRPRRRASGARHAFALVLVLIALALITVITVFFLSNVTRERRGVDQYSRNSEVRHLADTAVNLVMGQINAATKEGTAAKPVSWASQPGMIRTYAQTGGLSNAYKLYSWDDLVEPSTTFDLASTKQYPDAAWSTLPAQYTDLNAPINGVYPIADPTIANDAASGSPLVSGSTPPVWDFPGEFSVLTSAKGYAATTSNKLPMPVKWIYVLRDGSWVTPKASGADVTVSTATAANPIVGRMAFWTDDETSKVNVNTASEGSFWDTPKAATQDEMQFAGNPPAKGEFQRISGHPATTSLSAVFPETRVDGFSRWTADGGINTIYKNEMKQLLDFSPRVDWASSLSSKKANWGGSQAGTFPVTSYNQTYAPGVSGVNDAVLLDSDRLYASADEALFKQWDPLISPSAKPDRVINDAFYKATTVDLRTEIAITPAQLAQRLFLLTANSRAPETTLFETPRISLWPVTWPYALSTYYVTGNRTSPAAATLTPSPTNLPNNPWMTYQERLIAFCSTLNQDPQKPENSKPYYFQRQNPDSPTADWTKIPRNQEMVGYLSRELRQAVPGMGSSRSLAAKWGNDNSDWIALNCFDYSRSLINQYTYRQDDTDKTSDYLYSFTALRTGAGMLNGTPGEHAEPNAFTVTPLHVALNGNTYTTEGAFPALKEACMVFYASSRRNPALKTPSTGLDPKDPNNWNNLIMYDPANPSDPTKNKSQTTGMRAVMLLSFSGMNPGVWSNRYQTYYSPVFWVKVSRVDNGQGFMVNGTDIGFPVAGSAGNVVQYGTDTSWSTHFMSATAASLLTIPSGVAKAFTSTAANANNWTLISNPAAAIQVSGDATTFDFKGSKIQIDIYAPSPSGKLSDNPTGDPSLLISSQQIDFSEWDSGKRGQQLPIPLAPRWNVKQNASVAMPNTSFAAPSGWQTELVPTIGTLNNQTTAGLPDPRNPSYALSAAGEPVLYAYIDSTGTLMSPNFQKRLLGFRYSSPRLFGEGSPAGADLFYGSVQPQGFAQATQLITPYDTAISMVSDPNVSVNSKTAGDARVIGRGSATSAGSSGSTSFVAIDDAFAKLYPATPPKPVHLVKGVIDGAQYARTTDQAQYHTLSMALGARLPTGYWQDYRFVDNPSGPNPAYGPMAQRGGLTQAGGLLLSRDTGDAAIGVDTNITNTVSADWDWTSMPGNFPDGGYVARPDQDYQVLTAGSTAVPYFNDAGLGAGNGNASSLNVFVPNRQVPSPVVLGTLPSDMRTGWQTLAFSPNPAKSMNSTNGTTHPGVGVLAPATTTGPVYSALPDHLLLDLFWMPIAEPYPVSDQLSTAGKVNLNYAMMPFPYIKRKSGMDAVLKSVWLTALPSPKDSLNFANYYKSYGLLYNKSRLDKIHTRFPLNVEETLKAFDYKFDQGDIFRSASQICDQFLYPNNPDANGSASLASDVPPATSAIKDWWSKKALTADNVREDPYSAIYSRITTKSNTFTVHWKVQALQKRIGTPQTTWTENSDAVTSELRGSTLIERFIDPNATDIPDYAMDNNSTALPLGHYYKWRTVAQNYFQP